MLLQRENARPHTSLKTWEGITKFGWTVLAHPPYSPNLVPSDFHLFGALKNAVHGVKFQADDNVISREWIFRC
jgi:histone-lysine N-methyltransferase SETMAR